MSCLVGVISAEEFLKFSAIFFIDDGIDLEAVNRDFVEYGGELEKRL